MGIWTHQMCSCIQRDNLAELLLKQGGRLPVWSRIKLFALSPLRDGLLQGNVTWYNVTMLQCWEEIWVLKVSLESLYILTIAPKNENAN